MGLAWCGSVWHGEWCPFIELDLAGSGKVWQVRFGVILTEERNGSEGGEV